MNVIGDVARQGVLGNMGPRQAGQRRYVVEAIVFDGTSAPNELKKSNYIHYEQAKMNTKFLHNSSMARIVVYAAHKNPIGKKQKEGSI